MDHVISTSRSGRWLARVDAVPPWAWLALHAAALWTHWRWAAARLGDGSDDPLGVAALVALVLGVARLAPKLRSDPRPAWLASALALSVAATASTFVAPPLLGALLAALALTCGLRAFMPANQAWLPLAGLALLALPLVSSLQFYAGDPLRLLTAQLSTWVLQMFGLTAERIGSAMQVEGRLIVVDAPCSGVQMVWMAYFCACAVATFADIGDRRFVRKLPWIGVLVLAGNVVRNSILVVLEARGGAAEWLHQGIGMVVLAVVCLAVAIIVRGGRDA
jgi:exosortase/archaeosortase family protein